MRIIRYEGKNEQIIVAALDNKNQIYDLPFQRVIDFLNYTRGKDYAPSKIINNIIKDQQPESLSINEINLLVPLEVEEVWAAGVTYEKSKEARNFEATIGKTDQSDTFYDKVYNADRPELFFKSTGKRVIGQNREVNLRSDSNWQIPEPELGLVLDKKGNIFGYTIGNDMSCRDIEGDNPLYLPQAKIWKNSCSIGPALLLADAVENPYDFEIICKIYRGKEAIFTGIAKLEQLKRKLDELVDYLIRDYEIYDGTVLLTGTCIVPPNDFTLKRGDEIKIEIPGIGVLANSVNDINSDHTNERDNLLSSNLK